MRGARGRKICAARDYEARSGLYLMLMALFRWLPEIADVTSSAAIAAFELLPAIRLPDIPPFLLLPFRYAGFSAISLS
jgi:hypothetical protein